MLPPPTPQNLTHSKVAAIKRQRMLLSTAGAGSADVMMPTSPTLLQKEPQLSSSLISQGSAATTTGGGVSHKEQLNVIPH
jgi:hypothetical protein